MKQINTNLDDLRNIYNCIAESVLIIDKDQYIVLINEAAQKQFILDEEEAVLRKITEFIPIDEQNKVLESISNSDTTYFEVMLKKSDYTMFDAYVSGQSVLIEDEQYGILTIMDTTMLKQAQKDQLKKLKSHIITQATTNAQKQSELKGQTTMEINELQDKYDQLKHEMFMLERKLTLFERENRILNEQCEKIEEDSFSFDQILDREIALARRYGRNFSLAIVAIDDFKDLTEQLKTETKRNLVIKAFKKHFRSTIRTTDVVYYLNSGWFYFILPNTKDMNIMDLINRLLHAKRIDTKIIVNFNCGLAHYYEQDTREHIMYRVRKNLEANIEKKLKVHN